MKLKTKIGMLDKDLVVATLRTLDVTVPAEISDADLAVLIETHIADVRKEGNIGRGKAVKLFREEYRSLAAAGDGPSPKAGRSPKAKGKTPKGKKALKQKRRTLPERIAAQKLTVKRYADGLKKQRAEGEKPPGKKHARSLAVLRALEKEAAKAAKAKVAERKAA